MIDTIKMEGRDPRTKGDRMERGARKDTCIEIAHHNSGCVPCDKR